VGFFGVVPGVSGSVVVQLAAPLAHGATVELFVPGLRSRELYCVRASVNNAVFRGVDWVGPVAGATPACLAPLPPTIADVVVAVPTLPSAGGQAIVVRFFAFV
jgi:hypothetical protein